jgi:hypothetical protein
MSIIELCERQDIQRNKIQKKPDSEVHKNNQIQRTSVKILKVLYQSGICNHKNKLYRMKIFMNNNESISTNINQAADEAH